MKRLLHIFLLVSPLAILYQSRIVVTIGVLSHLDTKLTF